MQLYRARFSSNARVISAIMDYGYLYLLTVETSEYLIMENMEDLFAFCESREQGCILINLFNSYERSKVNYLCCNVSRTSFKI